MKLRTYLYLLIVAFDAFSGAFVSMVMPGADRIVRVLTFGGDALVLVIAGASLLRNRTFYGVRFFVLFCFISTLTFLYNSEKVGIMTHLNGLREPLFFFSTLIIAYDVMQSYQRETFVKWFTWFLIILAASQLPLVLYQFFKFGAGDYVGGTYGTGGGSGLITRLLFLITFYLITRFGSPDDGETFGVTKVFLFSALLIPCALNETKVAFLFLAAFIVLLTLSRKKAYKAIPFLVLGLTLIFLLDYYYSATAEDTREVFTLDHLEKYLYSNPTSAGGDLPRFQRMPIMFRIIGNDIGNMLLGVGYGLFQGGNILGMSRLARSVAYLTGSRMMLFSLWFQGGLLAVLVVAGTMFWFMGSRLISYHTIKRLKWFIFLQLILVWVYDEAIWDRVFASAVTFLMIWTSNGGVRGEHTDTAEGGEEAEEESETVIPEKQEE